MEQTEDRSMDDTFNPSDGDLSLVCHERPAGPADKPNLHIFKVHRQVLAISCTFFDDMLKVSGDPEQIRIKTNAPELVMEESVAVVRALLGLAYNNSELIAGIITSRDWKFVLCLWEAANKYSFFALRALSSCVLR